MSAGGGDPIHLAGAQEIADAAGEPVAAVAAFPSFHVDPKTFPLDVSDDGRRIVFAAQAESAGDDIFSLQEGGAVTSLLGPVERVRQVAVSGDGQTVAFANSLTRQL